MKKIIALISLLLCAAALLSLSGCGKNGEKQDGDGETYVLRAVITEISDGNMLVAPVENSPELASSDVFSVPIANMDTSHEPNIGDTVEIEYDGTILESYPARLGNIRTVRVF